jgi:UDP-glucose 4-epimerase
LRGQAVHPRSNWQITILDLAKLIRERLGLASEIRFVPYDVAYQPGFEDMERRLPALALARRLSGFLPRRTLHNVIDDILCDGAVSLGARFSSPPRSENTSGARPRSVTRYRASF